MAILSCRFPNKNKENETVSSTDFKFRSHPADFEILYSAIKNFTLEMGITMERTSRAPIYFAAHDLLTSLFLSSGKKASFLTTSVMA